jgi:alpha-N-arabinofuranosidase
VTLFFVNKDMAENIEMSVDLRDFGTFTKVSHSLLHHDDVKAVNTEGDPDNVSPRQGNGGKLDNGRFTIVLPSLSWNVVRLMK